MARINTARLVMQAAEVAYRADIVRQDPAVIKAAAEARADIAQAGRSTAQLGRETYSAWRRTDDQRH